MNKSNRDQAILLFHFTLLPLNITLNFQEQLLSYQFNNEPLLI